MKPVSINAAEQTAAIAAGAKWGAVLSAACGPVDEGAALMDHWRTWQAMLIDDFKPVGFSEPASISNVPVDPMSGFTSAAWLADLSDGAMVLISSPPKKFKPHKILA